MFDQNTFVICCYIVKHPGGLSLKSLRSVRSSGTGLLSVPKFKTKHEEEAFLMLHIPKDISVCHCL